MGKSRAAAFALGLHDNINEGEDVNTFAKNSDREDRKSQIEGNLVVDQSTSM